MIQVRLSIRDTKLNLDISRTMVVSERQLEVRPGDPCGVLAVDLAMERCEVDVKDAWSVARKEHAEERAMGRAK